MSEYFFLNANEPAGPFTPEQMKEFITAGSVDAGTLITRRPGESGWARLDVFDEFKDHLPTRSPDKAPEPDEEDKPTWSRIAAPPHLAACPDCGKEVSVTAAACPHCGRKLKQEQTAIGLLAAIIIALIIGGILYAMITR
jgi:hypothetical protein